MSLKEIMKDVNDNLAKEKKKRARLKDLDLIVLDNSLRESTVGQLRGHTLENKRRIYDEVRKCGFQFKIVAAYSHMTRVDDYWVAAIALRSSVIVRKAKKTWVTYLHSVSLSSRSLKVFLTPKLFQWV